MNKIKLISGICALVFSQAGFAMAELPFYVAVNAGTIHGAFNNTYTDLTDVIQQNISDSVQQYGYTGGIALGYTKLFCRQYLIGAEFSGNVDSHDATFQSGASTSAFSDTTQINNHLDLTIVPGILLTDSVSAYLKLGVSFASVQDNLISPVGFTPTTTRFQSDRNVVGFASALGIKKWVSERVSIFAEGNYHDYGKVNFSNFQNFTASYSHASHIYSYGMVLGAAYSF